MSSEEVKSTEQTVLEIITSDNAVYAKESPLPLAKEIKGIRAIFDEVIVVNGILCVYETVMIKQYDTLNKIHFKFSDSNP